MVEFIRGETELLRFQRLDTDGNVITGVPTEMYFSLKQNYDNDDYVFQKSLNDGIAQEGNSWVVTIDPADTASLTPGTYYFDIKVVTTTMARYVVKPQPCELLSNVTEEY